MPEIICYTVIMLLCLYEVHISFVHGVGNKVTASECFSTVIVTQMYPIGPEQMKVPTIPILSF